jgi:two-component system OmpR family response regulator
MRILVIEDDKETSDYIARGLIEEGHSVDCFRDGRDALIQATTEDYDVMIVDRMLPGIDGLSIVRTVPPSTSFRSPTVRPSVPPKKSI